MASSGNRLAKVNTPLPTSPKKIGTEITLHLREGEDEFLDDWRVRSIISKYSDHIAPPVEIEKREEKDGETVISGRKSTKRRRCGLVTSRKSPMKSTKSSTNTSPTTLMILLIRATTVLKVSRSTPACCTSRPSSWDMWNRDHKHGLKLYVQRVFIMDDAEQFMPNYLRSCVV